MSIRIDSLTKRFGDQLLFDGISLDIEQGGLTALIGGSGCGKTTLLRIVAGLSRPDAGYIRLNGYDLQASPRNALAQLSFLPQAPRFHARLTTRQVLHYYARLRNRSTDEAEEELARWALTEHARHRTADLSGGLRQRLALAICALARAPLFVLDEPGLSLDPHWRARLQEFLAEEAARGATVLVATHLLGEWEGRADRAFVLEHGAVAREAPVDALRDALVVRASERPPLPR